MKEHPAAPNIYNAVTQSLPVLCGILFSFSGAYFIGVLLGPWDYLEKKYIIDFGCMFGVVTLPIERKLIIALVSLLSSMLLLTSIVKSVSAHMLHDQVVLFDSPPPDLMVKKWRKNKDKAVSVSLLAFHFSIPTLMLSLFLLLDGIPFLLSMLAILFWYSYYAYKMYKEHSSSGI